MSTCSTARRFVVARRRRALGVAVGPIRNIAAVMFTAMTATLASFGCSRNVVRISDSSTTIERSISPRAYAAYARARLHERAGDTSAATASYEEVLRLDRDAAEAWIRLGALRCESNLAQATDAFERAARRNARSAALFHERALCALMHRDAEAALRHPKHSFLVVRIHQTRGATKEAERLLWSHVAVFPNDTAAWRMLANLLPEAQGLRAQVEQRARYRLLRRYPYWAIVDPSTGQLVPTPLGHTAGARVELEHALVTGDPQAAQRTARELGLGILQLISLAKSLGALELTRVQASLAGQIDPNNAEIWLLRLELADLLGDNAEFDRLLTHAPEAALLSSKREIGLLLDTIERRTGLRLARPSSE